MRSLFLIAAAVTALTTISAVPAMANNAASLKLNLSFHRVPQFCVPPARLQNECVAWGPAAQGALFGPCIKYQLQCVTPAQIH
ncbi:MAG: hypothetical protein P4M09_13960 [Devosia sp.]|nr:hypothetical protein [Devosia sp.]